MLRESDHEGPSGGLADVDLHSQSVIDIENYFIHPPRGEMTLYPVWYKNVQLSDRDK